jgi:hypothetical protein
VVLINGDPASNGGPVSTNGDAVAAPEPVTLLLLGIGLIGAAGLRRKLRK